jgi:hypothetical protein
LKKLKYEQYIAETDAAKKKVLLKKARLREDRLKKKAEAEIVIGPKRPTPSIEMHTEKKCSAPITEEVGLAVVTC